MNKKQIELLENELKIGLNAEKTELFDKYEKLFLEKNSVVNLISKNDATFLFEKHIFDSLAFSLFLKKLNVAPLGTLLDIGTGGGFPSVPLSILYDDLNVFALDSIKKKIAVIDTIKEELGLKNIFPICDRAENLQLKNNSTLSTPKNEKGERICKNSFDFVTSRAVAPMDVILRYALVNLKTGGYFIAYKSKKATEELKDAEKTLKQFKAKVIDIIEYTLPLEEVHERNLIIVRK